MMRTMGIIASLLLVVILAGCFLAPERRAELTATALPPTERPEAVIFGVWRFVGLGDSVSRGTPMPATSPEIVQFNKMLSPLTVEYQFNEDRTASFRANGTITEDRPGVKLEPLPITINETGTYEISADGKLLTINNMPSNLMALLGFRSETDPRPTEFAMTIEENKLLILRYSEPGSPEQGYIGFIFERVEG